MNRALIFIVFMMGTAHAEPLPLPKPPGPGGSCPHFYLASGSYCVPSQGAQDALPKPPNGTCPWGWTASGNYCLRSQRQARARRPRRSRGKFAALSKTVA
jgi:hypothetical protein